MAIRIFPDAERPNVLREELFTVIFEERHDKHTARLHVLRQLPDIIREL